MITRRGNVELVICDENEAVVFSTGFTGWRRFGYRLLTWLRSCRIGRGFESGKDCCWKPILLNRDYEPEAQERKRADISEDFRIPRLLVELALGWKPQPRCVASTSTAAIAKVISSGSTVAIGKRSGS